MGTRFERWFLRASFGFAAACMAALSLLILALTIAASWWAPLATFPFWTFGLVVGPLMFVCVWKDTR